MPLLSAQPSYTVHLRTRQHAVIHEQAVHAPDSATQLPTREVEQQQVPRGRVELRLPERALQRPQPPQPHAAHVPQRHAVPNVAGGQQRAVGAAGGGGGEKVTGARGTGLRLWREQAGGKQCAGGAGGDGWRG